MDAIKKDKDELNRQVAELVDQLSKKSENVLELENKQKEVLKLRATYLEEKEEIERKVREEMECTGKEKEKVQNEQAKAIKEKDKKIDDLNDTVASPQDPNRRS